jgi:hypothetical protein
VASVIDPQPVTTKTRVAPSLLLARSVGHAPNHSYSPPDGARAGANSGTSLDSRIVRSTRSIESGSCIAARNRPVPPHRGHGIRMGALVTPPDPLPNTAGELLRSDGFVARM